VRLRRGAALLAIGAALLGAAAEAGERIVRIDRASLGALRRESPQRWQQVRDILAAQRFIEDEALAGCLRAKFGAGEVQRSAVLLTTQPPQRWLSFVLDGVRYEGHVEARFRTGTVLVSEDARPDPCAPPAPRTRTLSESELEKRYEVVE
jgi:hypothetical protein